MINESKESYFLGNYHYEVNYSYGKAVSINRTKDTFENWKKGIESYWRGLSDEYEDCKRNHDEIYENSQLSLEERHVQRFKEQNPRIYEIMEWADGYSPEFKAIDIIEHGIIGDDPPDFESELTKYNADGVYFENGYWHSAED